MKKLTEKTARVMEKNELFDSRMKSHFFWRLKDPAEALHALKMRSKQRASIRSRLKNPINPKTGQPYRRRSIRALEDEYRTQSVYIEEQKAIIRIMVAGGRLGSGPKNYFERAVSVLFGCYLETRKELDDKRRRLKECEPILLKDLENKIQEANDRLSKIADRIG